jgi:hypothetical protein
MDLWKMVSIKILAGLSRIREMSDLKEGDACWGSRHSYFKEETISAAKSKHYPGSISGSRSGSDI